MTKDQAIRRWAKRHGAEVDTETLSPFAYVIAFKKRSLWKSLFRLCVKHGWDYERMADTVGAVEILPHFAGSDGASFELPCYNDPPMTISEDDLPF